MKKNMIKLIKKIRVNKNMSVFLLSFIIVGIISGSLFSIMINEKDKILVANYLNEFLVNLSCSSKTNIVFHNTLLYNSGFAILIWIFGISIIGIIFILPFLFIKAFTLGFAISSTILNLKFKGIIIVAIYSLPHQLINMLIYILISSYAIIVSYRIFNSVQRKKNLDFKKIMNQYSFILFFSLTTLLITSIYESYILPKIMRLIVNLIK